MTNVTSAGGGAPHSLRQPLPEHREEHAPMANPVSTMRGGRRATTTRRTGVGAGAATLAMAASVLVAAAPADAHGSHGQGRLAPRSHFTMAADGSSGLRADGDGI